MKLLFDQNISYRIIGKLPEILSGSKHVAECGLTNSDDSEIWEFSRINDFTIVTFDSDFFDLSLINGHPPKIIWIRTGNISTSSILNLLISNINAIERFIFDEAYTDIACIEIE